MEARALAYAAECGLKGELDMGTPTCVRYPIHGHGWTITLRERTGKGLMGTVRCDQAGRPVYWTMDSAGLG